MAVLGRILISGSQRTDLADILSIDSYVSGDFKYLLSAIVGQSTPYILSGFNVIDPGTLIGRARIPISVQVSDSVVLFPSAESGPFYYGLPQYHCQHAGAVLHYSVSRDKDLCLVHFHKHQILMRRFYYS